MYRGLRLNADRDMIIGQAAAQCRKHPTVIDSKQSDWAIQIILVLGQAENDPVASPQGRFRLSRNPVVQLGGNRVYSTYSGK